MASPLTAPLVGRLTLFEPREAVSIIAGVDIEIPQLNIPTQVHVRVIATSDRDRAITEWGGLWSCHDHADGMTTMHQTHEVAIR